jgi:uncharacterized protein YjbI with pentapeptide repeats
MEEEMIEIRNRAGDLLLVVCRTDLRGADLRGANLYHANLYHADLSGANLCGTDLRYADLRYADLRYADLRYADLRGTCLEPETPLRPISGVDLLAAGLEPRGGYVHGWRTRVSQQAGVMAYERGRIYVAPWFSTDAATDCHPGIYLAGLAWLEREYPGVDLVHVRCQRADLLHAGDKWRARAIEVIG